MSINCKVIERTEKEYLEDIYQQYLKEMKPLLDNGMSLTEAFRKLGIGSGRGGRKHREMRRIALEEGYKLRR